MKRSAAECSSEVVWAPASKRARRWTQPGLAGLLQPSFRLSPLRVPRMPWRAPLLAPHGAMLCCPPACGLDGRLWCATFMEPARDVIQISIASPCGAHEVFATGLSIGIKLLVPMLSDDLLLLSTDKTICRVARDSSTPVLLVESKCHHFLVYERGLLTLPIGRSFKSLERRDLSGVLLETFEFDFQMPGPCLALPGGSHVLYSEATQLWKVDLLSKQRSLVAGAGESGNRDGHGGTARFHRLKVPLLYTSDQIIVRDARLDLGLRICRIDLTTLAVKTLLFRGVEGVAIMSAPFKFPDLYIISQDQVFHADLSEDTSKTTFSEDMASVDWSEPMEVEFRLPKDVLIRADRRVLRARSQYFAAMLNPHYEMQEAHNTLVDLTRSPLDPEVFQAVLTYLATDELCFPSNVGKCSEPDRAVNTTTTSLASPAMSTPHSLGILDSALHCLSVIELADQYQLPRLVQLAECYILHVVLPKRDHLVLQLLERLPLAASSVAQTVWETIHERPKDILSATGLQEIEGFLARSPVLGARVLFQAAGVRLATGSDVE